MYLAVLVIDYRTSKTAAIDQMKRHLTALTGELAAQINGDLATAAQAARSTAAAVTDFQPRGRGQIDALERSVLATNRTIFGTAVAYEPGAFAAERQRFAPYLHREGPAGGLKGVDIAYDYARWDWYLLPKLLDRPAWTDPYFDEGAVATS